MNGRSDLTTRQRILEVATRLFAAQGYAGTTTRAIAAEVGANIATVHYHVGNKFELFRAVLESLYEEERALLEKHYRELEERTILEPEALIETVTRLVDAIVDLMAARPERPRLYLRRWVDPDDEIREVEIRMSLEVHRHLGKLLERAQAAGIVAPGFPVETFLRSFGWLIYGYFATGPIDWQHWFSDPLEPAHLADLRRLLAQYIRGSLLAGAWLPEETTSS